MDRLSNELLQEILNYAMLSNIPFCIDNFLDASKCAGSNFNDQSSSDVLLAGVQINSPDDQESFEGRPSAITTKGTTSDKIDSHLDSSQLPILHDWRLIIGTSKRFRELGKMAFFSHKMIVMSPETADLLRTFQLKSLSVENQKTMIKYTTFIVLSERSSQSPSSFLALSRRIAPFPRLIHIGFLFGYRKNEPLELLISAVQKSRPAPDHLRNALASLELSVDKFQMAVMTCPPQAWELHVANMQRFIYPVITIAAKARAKRANGHLVDHTVPDKLEAV